MAAVGPATSKNDAIATYTITVTNNGPGDGDRRRRNRQAAAQGASSSRSSVSPAATCTKATASNVTTVTCKLGTLARGATSTITLVAKLTRNRGPGADQHRLGDRERARATELRRTTRAASRRRSCGERGGRRGFACGGAPSRAPIDTTNGGKYPGSRHGDRRPAHAPRVSRATRPRRISRFSAATRRPPRRRRGSRTSRASASTTCSRASSTRASRRRGPGRSRSTPPSRPSSRSSGSSRTSASSSRISSGRPRR